MNNGDNTTGKVQPEELYNMSDEEIENLSPHQLPDFDMSEVHANDSDEVNDDDDQDSNQDDNQDLIYADQDNSQTEDDGKQLSTTSDDDDADTEDQNNDQMDTESDSNEDEINRQRHASDNDSSDSADDSGKGTDLHSDRSNNPDSNEQKADGDSTGTDSTDPKEAGSESESKPTKEQEESEKLDYKAMYEQLTAPFKANGRQMQVSNVDEALTLMKMGANYNKKMAGLAPHIRTVRTLEKAGINSEEDLNFLIDLKNKNPKAINKLVQDSQFDPIDHEQVDSSKYRPNNYTVSEEEVGLQQAIDDIKDTDTFDRTINIVGKEWDKSSMEAIGKEPSVINIINDHVADGIYDVIATEVNRQRALGYLNSLSDLQSYKQVGDQLNEQGGFNHLPAVQARTKQAKIPNPTITPTRVTPTSKSEDPKLKAKRKAASPSKASTTQVQQDFNPLNMSDEEFEKQFGSQLS